ncbi:Scr1 family TA system antitoxin-like transcriptional regulator [Amycolatopsis sp. NPDC004625]|uniref:Scr1 family TA system antitoxin-like transcriptional regulator n=1 Tax=Amycolatopsis sp. NPDC004625 TaxID=3154670 RepID=UPI0033BF14A6
MGAALTGLNSGQNFTKPGWPGVFALGIALRRTRMARRISLRVLAYRAGIHPGVLSAWELGVRAPKLEDVARLLGCLQVKKAEYDKIIAIFRQADGPTLIEPVSDITSPLLWHYEMTATRIFEWSPALIANRLQTAGYTQANLGNGILSEDEVSRRSLACAARPNIVDGNVPGVFTFFLSESALRSAASSPHVMLDQLHYLQKVGKLHHIKVCVVRGDASANVVPPFSIYESTKTGVTTIVHQNLHGVVYDAEPQNALRYLATVEAIRATAVSHSDSMLMIATAIDQLPLR